MKRARMSWCACPATNRSSPTPNLMPAPRECCIARAIPATPAPLIQKHGNQEVWLTPPPIPLTTPEMDGVYDLPYARAPHPAYGGRRFRRGR